MFSPLVDNNDMFDDGALENKISAAPLDRGHCPRNPGRFPIKCHQILAAATTTGNITNYLEIISRSDWAVAPVARTKQWQVQPELPMHTVALPGAPPNAVSIVITYKYNMSV